MYCWSTHYIIVLERENSIPSINKEDIKFKRDKNINLLTFHDLAVGVCFTGLDDVIVDREKLEAVGFVSVHHLSDLNVLQGDDALRLLILEK